MPKLKNKVLKKSKSKKPTKKKPIKSGKKKLPPKKKDVKVDLPKTIRISDKEPASKFREIGEMVLKKELRWLYYAVDNFVGYHYYLKINNIPKHS